MVQRRAQFITWVGAIVMSRLWAFAERRVLGWSSRARQFISWRLLLIFVSFLGRIVAWRCFLNSFVRVAAVESVFASAQLRH